MSRKPKEKKMENVDFNSVDFSDIEIGEGPVTIDNEPNNEQVVELVADDFLYQCAITAASREADKTYSNAQCGNRVFSASDVIMLCYRLDAPMTDLEIAKHLAKDVRMGQLVKEGRGKYRASHLMQLSFDDLIAEIDAVRASREAKKNRANT